VALSSLLLKKPTDIHLPVQPTTILGNDDEEE
jgi:hypothetical protein